MGKKPHLTTDDSSKKSAIVGPDEPRTESIGSTLARILIPAGLIGYLALLGRLFVLINEADGSKVDFVQEYLVQEYRDFRTFASEVFRVSEAELVAVFLGVSAALLAATVTAYVALVLSDRDRVLENRLFFSRAAVVLAGLWLPSAIATLVWLVLHEEKHLLAASLLPLCVAILWFSVGLGRFGRSTLREREEIAERVHLRLKEAFEKARRLANETNAVSSQSRWGQISWTDGTFWKSVGKCVASLLWTLLVLVVLSIGATAVLVSADKPRFDPTSSEHWGVAGSLAVLLLLLLALFFVFGAGCSAIAARIKIKAGNRLSERMRRLGFSLAMYLTFTFGSFFSQLMATRGEQTFGVALEDSWYLLAMPLLMIPFVWSEDIFAGRTAAPRAAKNRSFRELTGKVFSPLLPSIPNWRYRVYLKQFADATKELVQAQEDVRLATHQKPKLLLDDLSVEDAAFLRGFRRDWNNRVR